MRYLIFALVLTTTLFSCKDMDQDPTGPEYFFPSNSSNSWETITADSLGWDLDVQQELFEYLEDNNTRAFLVLQNGRIVIEEYWGKNITGIGDFGRNSTWYWASAGKTLTATMVGIAQQHGYLNIQDKTADYLGSGWTSCTSEQEDAITIWNQLTMTSGLDFTSDLGSTDPSDLKYYAPPGEQWYYHNAPYTLLQSVVASAVDLDFGTYLDDELLTKIGMDGQFIPSGNNSVFYSTPRDAARFGSLILNDGKWNDVSIIQDETFFEEMVTTSQDLNPSYGYLWWLNGKDVVHYPGVDFSVSGTLSEQAPDDLFAGMGANGQFVDIVPSKNMVVIRMGQDPDGGLVPVVMHDEMWGYIMNMIE